jgi:hypothetical protein
MDLNKYWREVHAVMEQMPKAPVYYLMSLDNSEKGTTAGQVCDIADKKLAARRLVEKTHRMATPEEAERYVAHVKRQTEELAQIEIQRKQQFAMPQDLQTLIQTAAQLVAQQAERNQNPKGK